MLLEARKRQTRNLKKILANHISNKEFKIQKYFKDSKLLENYDSLDSYFTFIVFG